MGEKALAHYQPGLEISEKLLTANPDSAKAARDVWVSCVRLTAVPEPSAALLGGLGMLALLRRRRA